MGRPLRSGRTPLITGLPLLPSGEKYVFETSCPVCNTLVQCGKTSLAYVYKPHERTGKRCPASSKTVYDQKVVWRVQRATYGSKKSGNTCFTPKLDYVDGFACFPKEFDEQLSRERQERINRGELVEEDNGR